MNFPFLQPSVDDASGRYTTGFFYGNNYFTGSLSLCTSIYRDEPQHQYQGKGN